MINKKLLAVLVVPCFLAMVTTVGYAFPDTAGCRTCHPNFQGGPGNATHDLHVGTTQMTNNCQLCHSSFFDAPVDINNSLAGVSCTGCHIPNGLWEHHQVAGISCAPCHTNWPTPDPEGTLPLYYSRVDVAVSDPCETDPALGGEDWSGDGEGLDNDGDDLYEAADPDCGSVSVEQSTWGAVKQLYEE